MTEETILCPKCSTKNSEGATLCEKCGATLNQAKTLSHTPNDVQETPHNVSDEQTISAFAGVSTILGILNLIMVMVAFFIAHSTKAWVIFGILAFIIATSAVVFGVISNSQKGHDKFFAKLGLTIGIIELIIILMILAAVSFAINLSD